MAGLALAASAALILWPDGDVTVRHAAALLVFSVGFWATGALPVHITALGFFLGAVLLAVAPVATVFSGFAATAFWLVFGGLIVGLAVDRTGLGKRLAHLLVGAFTGSYFRTVCGIVLVGLVMAFLMPSTMGRVVILVPIVSALADRLGYAPGTRGRHGLVMATALGSFMPAAAILPSNVANVVMTGAAETLYGVKIHYMEYLALHFPVLGLLKTAALTVIVWASYRTAPKGASKVPVEAQAPLSRDEMVLAVILISALALWATDTWHGVSPAWVALGAGFLCLLPGIALVPGKEFEQRMNWSSLVYVAGVLGMAAVVDRAGLGGVLADALVSATGLKPGEPAYAYGALALVGTVVGVVTTIGGVPGVLTPLAGGVAEASGLPLESVLMLQVLGFSTVILPYQLPPLVVAMQLGGVPAASGARATLILAVFTVLVLFPINYFWWRWLGYLA